MEDLETKKLGFDWEQAQLWKPMTSMHARCVLSGVTSWPQRRLGPTSMDGPPQWSAADCHARADELEPKARKATATWAREQCRFSAGLWRGLAKEAEGRETAAHKLAAE